MSRRYYKLLYLIWLLPAYLLFLSIHQAVVYYSAIQTYRDGESYTAKVIDFEIKKIAAQTNGFVELEFTTADSIVHKRKLSLSIDIASSLTDYKIIPIRYKPGNFEDIVMIPTYHQHRSVILSNLAMAFLGFLITLPIGWGAQRYAQKKLGGSGPDYYVIERIDDEPTD